MNSAKIIYWSSTAIVSLMMVFSAYMYFTNPEIKAGFAHMGFPDFFRKELGVAKIMGALVLLIPQVPQRFKEWAYAGFFIVFISAAITHGSVGDGAKAIVMPLVFLAILVVSYVAYSRLNPYRLAKV